MDTIRHLESLRRREHEATVELIVALIECARRGDHVVAGYASIWALLVERLEYSPAAASRRNAAVKIAMRCPAALTMLRSHRTSLTCLAKVAHLLRRDDFEDVLREIDGASSDEVERYLAARRPRSKPRERVTRIVARPRAGSAAELDLDVGRGASSSAIVPPSKDRDGSAAEVNVVVGSGAAQSSAAELKAVVDSSAVHSSSTSAAEPGTTIDSAAAAKPTSEDRVLLTFSVTADQYARFERARAKASRKHGPNVSIERTFEEMLASYIGHTPKSRSTKPTTKPSTKRTRHVPNPIRRAVTERDGHRCSYVAPDGTRCSATHDLQIDHVQPFAKGGPHTESNLRLLCGKHNRARVGAHSGSVIG